MLPFGYHNVDFEANAVYDSGLPWSHLFFLLPIRIPLPRRIPLRIQHAGLKNLVRSGTEQILDMLEIQGILRPQYAIFPKLPYNMHENNFANIFVQ